MGIRWEVRSTKVGEGGGGSAGDRRCAEVAGDDAVDVPVAAVDVADVAVHDHVHVNVNDRRPRPRPIQSKRT